MTLLRRAAKILLALLLAMGCRADGESDALRLARHIDGMTSHAHALLRAGFDATASSEDVADLSLLEQVAKLDGADADLAAQVQRYDAAKASRRDVKASAEGVLATLRVIEAQRAVIDEVIQPRPTHLAVRAALVRLPEAVAEIRSHCM